MGNIINKWVEVIEIKGIGRIDLKRGQRVIDTKIIHETLAPNDIKSSQYPPYKTIFVLECVEYEED